MTDSLSTPARALPITTLFVDIGGVLLSNGWTLASRQLAATTFGLAEAELEQRHHLVSVPTSTSWATLACPITSGR